MSTSYIRLGISNEKESAQFFGFVFPCNMSYCIIYDPNQDTFIRK
jgi:hypothetical protein